MADVQKKQVPLRLSPKLYDAINTAVENLGGKNATRFNAILNDWQRYRQAFIEAISTLH